MSKPRKYHRKVRSNARNTARKISLAILVVVATVFTTLALGLFRSLHQSLAQAGGSVSMVLPWSGATAANVLWLEPGGETSGSFSRGFLLHADPFEKRGTIVTLPPETLATLPSPFSPATIQAISKEFALTIEGYVLLTTAFGGQPINPPPAPVQWLPLVEAILAHRLETNISATGLLRLLAFFDGLREDQLTLGGTDLSDLGSYFSDGQVGGEGLRVVVLNGTDRSGLGGKAAERVRNFGAFVIDVGNAPEIGYEHSIILASNPESYTATRMARAFGISDLRGKSDDLEWGRRGDLILIVGLDKVDFF